MIWVRKELSLYIYCMTMLYGYDEPMSTRLRRNFCILDENGEGLWMHRVRTVLDLTNLVNLFTVRVAYFCLLYYSFY